MHDDEHTPGPMPYLSPNAQLTKLDSKLRHNFLTRTHTIPPEILAKIFVHLFLSTSLNSILERRYRFKSAEDDPRLGDPMNHRSEVDWSWVSVMEVCRHFRDIAMGCQQLWSLVDFGLEDSPIGTPWLNLCMDRVKSYPPTIRSCITGQETECSHLGTKPQLYTSGQAIYIVFHEFQAEHDIFPAIFNQSFPFLHCLYLVIDPPILLSRGKLKITSDFLGGSATQLTRLNMQFSIFGHMRFQIDGVPEFPSLLSLQLENCTMDIFSLRSLLSKTRHLKLLTLLHLHLKPQRHQPSVVKRPPLVPPFSQLRQLKWSGYISLDIVGELTPRSFPHLSVTFGDLRGASNADVYTYICDLVTRYKESASSTSQGNTSLSSCSLEETSHNEQGLSRISINIYDTWLWAGLSVRAPGSLEHMEMLFKHASSLKLRLPGAIKVHKRAILSSKNIRILHIALNGVCWSDVEAEVLALENIVALRAECGHKLESVDLSFRKVEREEDKLEVATHMKLMYETWKKKRWVKKALLSLPGFNLSTMQPKNRRGWQREAVPRG